MAQPHSAPRSHDAPAQTLRVLLFTDLVDSTGMKRRLGDVDGARAIDQHDKLFRSCMARFGGVQQDNPGDGFFATFDVPSQAVLCALDFQRGLAELAASAGMTARVGIHMGEVVSLLDEQTGEGEARVLGLAVDTAARIMMLADDGQVLLTRHAFDSVRQYVLSAPDGSPIQWLAHGPYRVQGLEEPLDVFEVGIPGVSPLSPPPDSAKARRAVRPGEEEGLGWRPAAAQPVPGRPGWMLEHKLGSGGFGEAWLAVHDRLRERRVFKFYFEPHHLRSLKRETVLFRVLKEALGDRPDIARILDWQVDTPPYFLESEYAAGGNLPEWLEARGGASAVPLETRVELVAQSAEALGAAHAVGVLHKDIKPSNILIASDIQGNPSVRLADFGIGHLLDKRVLEQRGITATGFTESFVPSEPSSPTGTYLYMAPELFAGQPATTFSDVHALGVVLYQLVLGDLRRPLAVGWERNVPDELLREDVAACVQGEPEDRLASAAELARRLRDLPRRRAERERERHIQEEAARARELAASESRRRTRQRHRISAGLTLLSLLALGLALAENWRSGNVITESGTLAIREAVQTNQAAAYWLAQAIERELGYAIQAVEGARRAGQLEAAVRHGDRLALQIHLDRLRRANPSLFSWAVADADGVLLARSPPDPGIVGKSFRFRDWFHGGNPDQASVTDTHISEPFRSQARGRRAMLAVSTPLRTAAEGGEEEEARPAGVLLATLTLQDLGDWVSKGRAMTAVVLNDRDQLVLHPENPLFDTGEPARWEPTRSVRRLAVSPDLMEPIEDPLQGDTFFVGANEIAPYGWAVLVLRPVDAVRKPIGGLVEHVAEIRWMVFVLAGVTAGIVLVWAGVSLWHRLSAPPQGAGGRSAQTAP